MSTPQPHPPSAASEAIGAWLEAGSQPGLWVSGPLGSGRTTAVAAAIRRRSGRSGTGAALKVKRVAAFHGMSVEEALAEIAPFLRQAGNGGLEAVLRQRAFPRAKVSILLEALRTGAFLLWVDDADHLLADGGAIDSLLEGVQALRGSPARVVITALGPPPAASAASFDRVDVGWSESPFARRFQLPVPADEDVDAALNAVFERLSAEALATLLALSALPPEPTRRAVGAAMEAMGVTLDLQAEPPDPRLQELEEHGLVITTVCDGAVEEAPARAVVLVEAVRRAALRRLEAREGGARRTVHAAIAAYHLRVAERSGEIWHFVRAWRAFVRAGHSEGAYETQKVFTEALIQSGSVDLARHVLSETVRSVTGLRRAVALGNLAILHKNSGEHGKALELYQLVHQEFAGVGDHANAARVLHQIGNTQYGMGRLDEAIEAYRRSLELSLELGARNVAVATRVQIANVHFLKGDRPRALEQYLEALEAAESSADSGLVAAVELQIGQIHLLEKRYVEAEQHLRQAESSSRKCKDWRGLVKVLEAQGLVAEDRREYDLARAKLDEAMQTALALGDTGEAAAAWLLAGQLEEKRLHLGEAMRCYLGAEDLLDTAAARSSSEHGAHRRAVEERLAALAATLGEEAYARVRRGVRGGV